MAAPPPPDANAESRSLIRRSRGGSAAVLRDDDDSRSSGGDSDADDDDAAPSMPPPTKLPLSTVPRPAAQRPLLSPLAALALLMVLAGAAVVGGMHLVGRARAASSSSRIAARGATAAAAATATATPPPPPHHQTETTTRPHHVTVAIADLHGDWPHAIVALRASGVISERGARRLPTPSEAELQWRLPSNHTLLMAGGASDENDDNDDALFNVSQLQQQQSGGASTPTLHLVQTGDLVDRGRHGLALVRLFGALRDAARQRQRQQPQSPSLSSSVTVQLLLGNHELLNLQGDAERYAHREELAVLAKAAAGSKDAGRPSPAGARAWQRLLSADGGGDLGDALRSDRAIAHVAGRGPCRALFVHAGLTPGLLKDLLSKAEQKGEDEDNADDERQPPSIIALNRAATAALRPCSGTDGRGCPLDAHPIAPLLLSGQGPVWTRALAPDGHGGAYRSNNQLALVCAAVDDVLRRVGGGGGGGGAGGGGDNNNENNNNDWGPPRRMVVGHTITRSDGSPTIACGGRLVFLDVGMSKWMWREADEEEEEASPSPAFGGPAPSLALRCEYGAGKPGAAELVFARPKQGHEGDDPRTAPLDVRRMPLPALGAVPSLGVAAAAAAGR